MGGAKKAIQVHGKEMGEANANAIQVHGKEMGGAKQGYTGVKWAGTNSCDLVDMYRPTKR